MDQVNQLTQHPEFDENKRTVFFVHGYHTSHESDSVKQMAKVFVLYNKDFNMVSLDWAVFARTPYFEVASLIARDVSVITTLNLKIDF